jgi:hypothetical protein
MAANQVLVGLQNNQDSANPVQARAGKYGEQIVTELRGKYSELSLRGQTFTASTVIAGVVIPVAAATLNSKFTIWNPAGSGKHVELISINFGIDNATTVVNGHGLMIQRQLTATSGIPTSLTNAAALRLGISGAAVAGVYTQATLTNVAVPGVSAATPVPIAFYPLFSFGAVTSGTIDPTHAFDGKIILEPDSLAAVCTTVAPSAATFIQICWAEHSI